MSAPSALLSDAIDEYERFRVSQGIAKSTLRNERTSMKKFLHVSGNIWMKDVSDRQVEKFRIELSRTKQPQSQRNDYTALSGFFKWAAHRRYLRKDVDPMFGWKSPKKANRERNRVPVAKFPALLDAAEARCMRDRAVVAVLMYTLLRDQEAADLRIMDLDLDSGYLKVRIFKTGVEDRMPICAELDHELRRWLTYYTEQVGILEPFFYLLPSRNIQGVQGADGSYERVEQLNLEPERKIAKLGRSCRPALESIGFPVKDHNGRPMGEGAHTIRRSGARAMFDQLVTSGYDGSLRVVQSMLHHKSIQQTEHYIGLSADRYTRDDLVRGKRLYAMGTNVVEMQGRVHGDSEGSRAAL